MVDTCDYLIIDIPFPPSLNALFEPHKIGKRCSVGKSTKYKDYQKKTFHPFWLSVRSKGKVDLGQDIIIWMIMCPERNGTDIDNRSKCFFDCLQHAGAFKDDNQVVSHRIEKGPRIRGGLLRVFMANERHRERLMLDYESELTSHWLPLRSGQILDRPQTLRHRRVAFVETPHPVGSQSGSVLPDTSG